MPPLGDIYTKKPLKSEGPAYSKACPTVYLHTKGETKIKVGHDGRGEIPLDAADPKQGP